MPHSTFRYDRESIWKIEGVFKGEVAMRILCSAILISIMGNFFGATQNTKQITLQNTINEERSIKEAQGLVQARERVGKELMAIVDDSDRSVPERLEAARLLGKLQYQPAIDVLIQHVDLVDPAFREEKERDHLSWPITASLAAYGKAAVPQIVDACLSDRRHQRRILLSMSIRFGDAGRQGDNTASALRYLRGTEQPDEKDLLKKRYIEELETGLKGLRELRMPTDRSRE